MNPGALIVGGMAVASVLVFLLMWAMCRVLAEGKGENE